MNRMKHSALIISMIGVLVGEGCGGTGYEPQAQPSATREKAAQSKEPSVTTGVSEKAPPSGTPKDIHFPPIKEAQTGNGLQINTVELHELPLVQIQLVIKSGLAADPEKLPGLSKLVAEMLKEGTSRHSSAELAEAIDYLGAHLTITNDQENIYIKMQAMSEHLSQAMALVAEMAMRPRFSPDEIEKLKKRELNRLALQSQNPDFLAVREFFRALYGKHPYSHIDATPEVVKKLTREDLDSWHKNHFAPNNAFLVVVGDVTSDQVVETAKRCFAGWGKRAVAAPKYPEPPTRDKREVIIVDRPQSVQSVIYLGNLALERSHPDYVSLLVANEVLGGSATSRLFSDLRERKGLTYGTYSHISEKAKIAPFSVYAAVRNEVTKEAMSAIMAHLDTIVKEQVPTEELSDRKRYLVDSFPLQIDTSNKIAEMIADLRKYSLANDYWDGYRTQIATVTSEQALKAAAQYIQPQHTVIVVVGKALDIKEALTAYGSVTIVDTEGNVIPQTSPQTIPSDGSSNK
jgi:zinc protease